MQQDEPLDYHLARTRIIRRLRRRIWFFVHLVMFLFALGAMWNDPNEKGVLPIFLLWMPLLMLHSVAAFDLWSRLIEHFVQQELQQAQYEKPKREMITRLGDDGELLFEESNPESIKRTLTNHY